MRAPNDINRGRRDVSSVQFGNDPLPESVDVLIVGAGPTGLGTALELARFGVSTAVVDAATGATLARAGAVGYYPRTVEVFRGWDLVSRLQQEWTVPPEWNQGNLLVTSLAGHVLRGVDDDSFSRPANAPFSREEALRRPQTVLQKVFRARLAELGSPVAGGWRVDSLRQDAEGVTTEVVDASGARRSIRSSYVVGADGSRSTVRRLSGIERSGEYATERYFRYVVRTVEGTEHLLGATPRASTVVFNNEYSGFISALNGTDWRAYYGPLPLDQDPTEKELLDHARLGFGVDVELELLDVTPYYKSTRIADRFVDGRVVLVGDAAHVRTPGGNVSEGFGDVLNLGWKLAAVLRGHGGDALLASYDEERRPHNWRVANHALEQSGAVDAAAAKVRAIGVPDDADLSPEATQQRARVAAAVLATLQVSPGVVFDERYDESSVIHYEPGQLDDEPAWNASRYVDNPRPGHRAPNGTVESSGLSLYDRIGTHVALLAFGAADGGVASAFLDAAHERGLDLEVVFLHSPGAEALYGAPYAIVRPDHHVAWRGTGADVDPGAILDRVFGRIPAATAADRVLVDSAAQ